MSSSSTPSRASLVTRVFLPFAAGYYLSYLMRTVNAVISPDLTRELGKTVVAVTHDLTFASAADRRIGIVDGLIAPDWRA